MRDAEYYRAQSEFYAEIAETIKRPDYQDRWLRCKNWYSISRAVSDNDAHRGNMDDRSVRAFAVKPRAFGAPHAASGL